MKDQISVWNARLEDIKYKLSKGIPLKTIGAKYGVSRQRMYQIIQEYGLSNCVRKYHGRMKFLSTAEYRIYRLVSVKSRQNIEMRDLLLNELLPPPKYCPVLGLELDYSLSSRSDRSPSIDRINNDLGYVPGNCIVVSWRANRLKNDGSIEEHFKIYQYYSSLLTKSIVQL